MTQSYNRKHASGESPAWAQEMTQILDAYKLAGGDPEALQLPKVATLVINTNHILAVHEIPGVVIHAEPLENGVRADITVEPNTKVEQPIHLCFGVVPADGVQDIIANYEIGENATAQFLAHCSFPNAVHVKHNMKAHIHVSKNASLTYTEEHFHGENGGVEVYPFSEVMVDEGGQFFSTFALTRGRIGLLSIDYQVYAAANAVVKMTTKAYGFADDKVKVNEVVHLDGEKARGLTLSRVAVREHAVSQIFTTMEGNAAGARGHMDCTEIVRGQAVAHNTPLVVVRNDQAQVTHEAAIGSVNQKELEALMAKGLDEDEAVDLIIRGMIR